jgi:hypothetical protein
MLGSMLKGGQMTYKDVLTVGDPVPVSELLKKPAAAGRQPSPIDLALIDLVNEVGTMENAEKAFAWDYQTTKPITARAAATRAIERAGQTDKVFVSNREGKLWFSQIRLSKRGAKRKK